MRTIAFLPTWTIVDSRLWKAQVPYFSRHGFRVVTFDNRGNGRSDRPSTGYSVERIAQDALTVLDAVGVEQAAIVALSAGGRWAIKLAAEHPKRISHLVLIGASVTLGGPSERIRLFHAEGSHEYRAEFWRTNYPDFVEHWAQQVHSEPHSTKQIE